MAQEPGGRAALNMPAAALAEAGGHAALTAAGPDPQTAFAVQRLARRTGAVSQAIDAANEMALRVMTRQVPKALGGLDAESARLRVLERRLLDWQ